MATQAHCAFCFDTLRAPFDKRPALGLAQVEDLWERYQQEQESTKAGASQEQDEESARPAAISRLLNKDAGSPANSDNSLPSTPRSGSSSKVTATPASSKTSLSSKSSSGKPRSYGEYPLFVTWNQHSARSGQKSLRGCIGTFAAQELESGLQSYALTSALEDTRFSPIPASLLPQLSVHVTLLTNFSSPVRDPYDWTIGTHGIRISFTLHGRRYGATYLPSVAEEQGWTKEEALISLMKKAGWNGSSSSWEKTWKDGRGELVRYEGEAVGLEYKEWKEWDDWVRNNAVL